MQKSILDNFNNEEFWESDSYAKEYICESLTDEMIKEAEEKLGYKLPKSYIKLLKYQNGGIPNNTCHKDSEVFITTIFGISNTNGYNIVDETEHMTMDWGYPDIGVYICDCPSAGHDCVMLDYSECGKDGEPQVSHIDQESDYYKTVIAKDFETFINGLVGEDEYEF